MEMNKTEMVNALSEKYGMTKKDAKAMLEAVVDTLVETLEAGNSVALPGFGKLKIVERGARIAHSPATGEAIEVPAKKVVTFKVAKALKDAVAEL